MIYRDLIDLDELYQYVTAINARAKTYRASGEVTAVQLRSLILESGGMCQWCSTSLLHKEFEIEHVMTLSKGGTNAAHNLVVSCPSCNRKKAEKHPVRFVLEHIAETGVVTPFSQRILDYYGEHPQVQHKLFESEEVSSHSRIKPVDEDSPPVSPYQW